MNLLMVSADTNILADEKGPFFSTLEVLRTHWDRVDVICPKSYKKQVVSCKSEGIQTFENVFFHPSPYKSKWLQPKWICSRGKQIILEHQSDVITVHAYPPFLHALGALWLSRNTGVPHGLEFHGFVDTPVSTVDRIGKMLTRIYIPVAANAAAGIRVINSSMKQQMVRWGIAEDLVSVLPSFYWNKEIWRPDGSVQKEYDAVFVGRIDKNKGLEEVIQAVGSGKREAGSDKSTLLVIGDGPEKKACEKLTRELCLENHVTFVGWLKEASDVANMVRKSKVLIMNSKSEGGPRVTLEAMACGVPVLSTAVGHMPDVLRNGENGYFVNGTPEDIAAKLKLILSDNEKRKHMGRSAAASLEQFDRVKLIEDYAQWMKKVVNS